MPMFIVTACFYSQRYNGTTDSTDWIFTVIKRP